MHIKSWGLALVLIVAASVAHAGKPEDDAKARARVDYVEATKHFNLGEYQSALTRFKEAYRAFPDPSLLFNIAQCHRMLDQKVEALRSYRTYLRDARSGKAEIEQVIAGLEKAIAEEQAAKAKTPIGTMGDPTTTPSTPPTSSSAPPNAPPATRTAPTTTEPAPPPAAETSLTRAPATKRPLHKRAWFWAVLGGAVVVVGVGVGVGVALGTRKVTYPSGDMLDDTFRF